MSDPADPEGLGALEGAVDVGQAGPVVALAAGLEAIAVAGGLAFPELAAVHLEPVPAGSKEVEKFEEVEVYRFAEGHVGTAGWQLGLRACSGVAPRCAAECAGQAAHCSPVVEPDAPAEGQRGVAAVACFAAGHAAFDAEGA